GDRVRLLVLIARGRSSVRLASQRALFRSVVTWQCSCRPMTADSSASTKPRSSQRAPRKAKARRSLTEDALNLPNLLTMLRVVMIPLCLYFLDRGDQRSCFWAALV